MTEPGVRRPVRVLYVGGWGRSGSTLLDLMLGQVPGFASLGEVRYLWERGLQERQRCGCGVPVPECPFWGDVLGRAFGGLEDIETRSVLARWRRVDGLARVPWLAGRGSPGFDRDVKAFRELLARLYTAAAAVTGADVLVDSSKYAAYGLLLSGVPGVELRTLHLVRDSRAVAHSWTRRKHMPEVATEERYMPRKGPWRSAFYWSLENLGLQLLRRRSAAYHLLRYEDLAYRPGDALARALHAIGMPAPPPGFLEDGRITLGENHTVAGNPLRFRRGQLTVTPDSAWHMEMPPHPRRIVTALTWPLLRRYGFRSSGAAER